MNASQAIKNTTLLTGLTAAFEQSSCPRLPLLDAYQRRQFERFSRRGLPSRREEAWKYTDLSFLENSHFEFPPAQPVPAPMSAALQALLSARAGTNDLLVFVNGHYAPQLSSVSPLPQGVVLSSLKQALTTQAALLKTTLFTEPDAQQHPFASLNAALFKDGLFLYVPQGVILERPVHLLSLSLGSEGFMAHPRHVVIAERDAQLSLTEEYSSEAADHYLTNVAVDFFVGRNASVNYYKLQNEAKGAAHFASLFFHQQQNSLVNACSFAVGGRFTRNDLTLSLQEDYAACRVNGFYGLDADGQVMDQHIHIEHAAPKTQSAIDYRGVLARRSRAIFNGKVRVQPEAQKTEARQLNHNLLLSPLAEIDTKPELEIYADEVQCRHGATTGQLDEESLFYLRARGLDHEQAKALLLQAFVEAVLSEVTLPSVSEAMRALWGRQLVCL